MYMYQVSVGCADGEVLIMQSKVSGAMVEIDTIKLTKCQAKSVAEEIIKCAEGLEDE